MYYRGPKFYKFAKECYTKALVEQIDDPVKVSIYYSNRSAVNLQLGNYAKTIEDCVLSLKNNPQNIKASFRAAQALTQLEKFDQAFEFLDKALGFQPNNKTILKEKNEVKRMYEIHKSRVEASEKRKQKLDYEKEYALSQKGEWIKQLHQRKIAIGHYLFESMSDYLQNDIKPYFDVKTKEMHWPVLFIYEEHKQLDFIQDFVENQSFGSHLKTMFPNDQFCSWDTEKKYIHTNLEIFFFTNQTRAFIEKDPNPKNIRKIKANQNTILKKVLEHTEYVVPGYPIFYIVPKHSKFKEEFLKKSYEQIFNQSFYQN